MTRTYLALLAICLVASCGPMPENKPIISDFNGASVKLQMQNYFGEGRPNAASQAEASRICATGGKRRAEYASSIAKPNYVVEHLYLCL